MSECKLQQLRKSGFDVRISHHRQFNGVGLPKYEYNSNEQWGVDNVLTRYEYNQAGRDGLLRMDFDSWEYHLNVYGGEIPKYGEAVSCVGGFTEVEVTTPSGSVLRGKHNFNRRPFNRKIGLAAALGKALKETNHATQL